MQNRFEIYGTGGGGEIQNGDIVYLKHHSNGKWLNCGSKTKNSCKMNSDCPNSATSRAHTGNSTDDLGVGHAV